MSKAVRRKRADAEKAAAETKAERLASGQTGQGMSCQSVVRVRLHTVMEGKGWSSLPEDRRGRMSRGVASVNDVTDATRFCGKSALMRCNMTMNLLFYQLQLPYILSTTMLY